MPRGPLAHLRVIDLSQDIAGPYFTKLMAGFGAEVIKIEPPEGGDRMRGVGPFFQDGPGPERSIPFLWLNTGKKSVTLDINKTEDLEILRTLLRDADVVVENFPPGTMARLGLGYEELREFNPRIVMTSLSPFGQSGPYKDYQAEDIELYALSGGMYLTGDPERAPLTAGPAVCQYSAGLCAYMATLMALFQRHNTGEGQQVDVSIQEAALDAIEMNLAYCLQMKLVSKRSLPPSVPWTLYPCLDGYAMVICGPFRHWLRGVDMFQEPKLLDGKYKHVLDRVKYREEVEALIQPWLKSQRKQDVFHAGQARKMAFGYLATFPEVLKSPQHKSREFFVGIEHPVVGTHKYCGAPFVLSKTPWQSARAPRLGEHNTTALSFPPGRSPRHEQSLTVSHSDGQSPSDNYLPFAASSRNSTLPLEGVRIIDLCHSWSGPHATRILADYGAQVIRVEYVRRLCLLRGTKKENQHYNRHIMWHQINRNKLSITLDLEMEKDLQVLKDLLRISDVFIENARGSIMERFGLAYPDVVKINPDIIMVSMSGFGKSGPYSSYAAYGGSLETLCGMQNLTGYQGDPKRVRVKEVDIVNGEMGACAVMTALVHRQRTGEGQWIDLSQLEAVTHALIGEHLLEYVMNGTQTLPLGNRHRWFAPQGCYRCQGEDKWVVLTVRTEEEWRKLCELLGHPEWKADQRFATHATRRENHDALDRLIEEWTRQHTHYEVMHLLQGNGLAAGAVLNVAELSEDPHLNKRDFFMKSKDDTQGLFPGLPFRLSRGSGAIRWRGPDLGQHNEYVFTELLGLSKDAVRPINENDIGTAYDPE